MKRLLFKPRKADVDYAEWMMNTRLDTRGCAVRWVFFHKSGHWGCMMYGKPGGTE
jgi:hypothetical protein